MTTPSKTITTKKQKTVKAWAIVHRWDSFVLGILQVEKKPKKEDFGLSSNQYRVVPCTITYETP